MSGAVWESVLEFWFGELDSNGCSPDGNRRRWWTGSELFDAECRRRFAELHGEVMNGDRDHWLDHPRGRLAYIVVLDQLSRNMFRGTPAMYAGDPRAVEATRGGIDRGHDRVLALDERVFFYMPLMHSETLADQDLSLAQFRSLVDEQSGELASLVAQNVRHAEAHRDVVVRFGRFPHRNEILGRASTAEEEAFLDQPGSSF